MRYAGTLRSWKDDKGFGFIAPTHGGPELFVHISALPRDGSRPTVGERLTYELGTGPAGRPQAVEVRREAIAGGRQRTAPTREAPSRGSSGRWRIAVVLVVVLAGVWGFDRYRQPTARGNAPSLVEAVGSMPGAASPASLQGSFQCDGRRYCSQMTSCSEARYFLRHCPDVQMDGNHDGTPCEQQWCTGPLAR